MKINFRKAAKLFEILKYLIPAIQFEQLQTGVNLNPELTIKPQKWFVDSFEWYFAIDLIPGFNYGPFYQVGGDRFWPQIGIPDDASSEKNCFYGLQKPIDVNEAIILYDLKNTNPMVYVYEFKLNISKENFFQNAQIFIGPVKNGEGFQINPNTITSKIIQLDILANKVCRYRICPKEKYSETCEIYEVSL
jgi:hypothetical protein